MGIKKWRQPDTDWLLKMLATCDENHQIFQKDWEVPREEKPIEEKAKVKVPNGDDFFSNMPAVRASKAIAKKRLARGAIDENSSSQSKLEKWKK